jgi:4-hydroxy-tetrahydrodipicolinate reductase
MAAARGKPFLQPSGKGETPVSRGLSVEGVSIHSVRLPGLMAHQEVILGGQGQTLTIRHDTISRECYMPGVLLAIREVSKRQGLTYGLDGGIQRVAEMVFLLTPANIEVSAEDRKWMREKGFFNQF